MKTIINTLALALVALLVVPAFADETTSTPTGNPSMSPTKTEPSKATTGTGKSQKTATPKMTWQDEAGLVSHLNTHVTWPATGSQLIESCNNLSDVNEADKKAFTQKIEKLGKNKTYASAQEVLNSVNK